jgi:hypothetical protein
MPRNLIPPDPWWPEAADLSPHRSDSTDSLPRFMGSLIVPFGNDREALLESTFFAQIAVAVRVEFSAKAKPKFAALCRSNINQSNHRKGFITTNQGDSGILAHGYAETSFRCLKLSNISLRPRFWL